MRLVIGIILATLLLPSFCWGAADVYESCELFAARLDALKVRHYKIGYQNNAAFIRPLSTPDTVVHGCLLSIVGDDKRNSSLLDELYAWQTEQFSKLFPGWKFDTMAEGDDGSTACIHKEQVSCFVAGRFDGGDDLSPQQLRSTLFLIEIGCWAYAKDPIIKD